MKGTSCPLENNDYSKALRHNIGEAKAEQKIIRLRKKTPQTMFLHVLN